MCREEQTEESIAVLGETQKFLRLEEVVCPLCGSRDSRLRLRGRDNLTGMIGDFCVEQCQQCQHCFMNPRPTLETNQYCYPEDYSPHVPPPVRKDRDADEELANQRPWYLRLIPLRHVPGLRRFVYWLLDDKSQIVPPTTWAHASAQGRRPRALEVGCATGRYLLQLEEIGWEVTGVEPMERPAMIARGVGLDVRVGTLDNLKGSDVSPSLSERESRVDGSQQWDLIAAWMVVEHVPDPRRTLLQMYDLLREGGTLMISVPNIGCWEPWIFGRHWYCWELPRHLQHFTTRSMQRLLTECGYTEIHVFHHRSCLNLFGSLGIWLKQYGWTRWLGSWLMDYTEHPRLAGRLLTAPLAHLLAAFGQSGRMTWVMKRP